VRVRATRELLRPVRDDEVGAGALDRRQRLERRLPLVEMPGAAAAFTIAYSPETLYARAAVEALAHGADHVEVRQRRLDHQHVGALGDVELALAQRLAHVARDPSGSRGGRRTRRRLGASRNGP
jgi:hypothetical protein